MAYKPLKEGESVREKVIRVPKTPQSNRYIKIDKDLARQLRGKESVTDLSPDKLSQHMRRFLQRYGNYHMHTLRHFFVSYNHSIGVSDADIMAAGGWKTTHIMQSVYRQSQDRNKASESIEQLLKV